MTALAGGGLLTYGGLQPLRDLTGAVRTIVSTGRLGTRVPVRETGDPLDELGGLVNGMLDRIETLVDGMRGALDNVAHDLRTPLARLRSVAETGLRSEDPEAAREALTRCLEECERVAATLTALMDISEAETGTLALGREMCRCRRWCATPSISTATWPRRRASPSRHEIADDLRGPAIPPGCARCWPTSSTTPSSTRRLADACDVDDDAGAGWMTFACRDTGIGIAPDEVPRVWERLYRGDRSRSERGLGLGLSLVRAIVEAHGGRVARLVHGREGQHVPITIPAAPIGAADRSPAPRAPFLSQM